MVIFSLPFGDTLSNKTTKEPIMNKERRKALEDIVRQLTDDVLKPLQDAKEMLEALKDDLSGIQADEQDYFDNMPEAFQSGDKGQAAEAAIAEFDGAISDVESAIDHIENAKS